MDPLSLRIRELADQGGAEPPALAALRADVDALRAEVAGVGARMEGGLRTVLATVAARAGADGRDLEPRLAVLEDTLDAVAERVEACVRDVAGVLGGQLDEVLAAVAALRVPGVTPLAGRSDSDSATLAADLSETVAEALAGFAAALDRGLGGLAAAVAQSVTTGPADAQGPRPALRPPVPQRGLTASGGPLPSPSSDDAH